MDNLEKPYRRIWIIHPEMIVAYSMFMVVGFNVLVALGDDWMLPMATLQIPLSAVYMHLSYMVYFHRLDVQPRDVAILLFMKSVADLSGFANHIRRYEHDSHLTEFYFLLIFVLFDMYALGCLSKMMTVLLQAKSKEFTALTSLAADRSNSTVSRVENSKARIQTEKPHSKAELVPLVPRKEVLVEVRQSNQRAPTHR